MSVIAAARMLAAGLVCFCPCWRMKAETVRLWRIGVKTLCKSELHRGNVVKAKQPIRAIGFAGFRSDDFP